MFRTSPRAPSRSAAEHGAFGTRCPINDKATALPTRRACPAADEESAGGMLAGGAGRRATVNREPPREVEAGPSGSRAARDGRHRLYFWAHGPQITRYLAAESEDGRRYRVVDPLRPVLYHPNDRAAFGVPSPDGVMFGQEMSRNRPADEPLATSRLISNDATNIYQLADGTFEMYSVALVRVEKTDPAYVAEDNAPGLLRVIDRYISDDGLHFENRRRVIQRDAADPVDQQFYYLSATYTPNGCVGMLGHYRCKAQTMDLEWCFSRDGIEWRRPLRSAWIARGQPPAPDCYGIYAGSHLVEHGGRWHLFYTGVNSSHNGRYAYGRARQVVMLATTDSIWG